MAPTRDPSYPCTSLLQPAPLLCREVFLQVWLFSRFFETSYFRTHFHPDYFVAEAHETPEMVLSQRKAGAEKLIAMGRRMLQEDMAEVRGEMVWCGVV